MTAILAASDGTPRASLSRTLASLGSSAKLTNRAILLQVVKFLETVPVADEPVGLSETAWEGLLSPQNWKEVRERVAFVLPGFFS